MHIQKDSILMGYDELIRLEKLQTFRTIGHIIERLAKKWKVTVYQKQRILIK